MQRIACLLLLACVTVTGAEARDLGQWEGSNPAISQWFRSLMQPDNPSLSCCGESDAYWADDHEIGPNGEYIAIITDTRPDEPLRRPHIPPGTKFVVPNHKLKWDRGNPTGHQILFVGPQGQVYCFVQGAGVV